MTTHDESIVAAGKRQVDNKMESLLAE